MAPPDKTERTLATLVEFADIQRQNLAKTTESIDALTAQVSVLTTGINELKDLSRQILQAAHEQNETAKLQAQNVAALIRLLETTVSRG